MVYHTFPALLGQYVCALFVTVKSGFKTLVCYSLLQNLCELRKSDDGCCCWKRGVKENLTPLKKNHQNQKTSSSQSLKQMNHQGSFLHLIPLRYEWNALPNSKTSSVNWNVGKMLRQNQRQSCFIIRFYFQWWIVVPKLPIMQHNPVHCFVIVL